MRVYQDKELCFEEKKFEREGINEFLKRFIDSTYGM